MNFLRGPYAISCSMKLVRWQVVAAVNAERAMLMSIEEVSAERLAELFHHYNHALAIDSGPHSDGRHTRWNELPVEERNRMTTAARLALLELESLNGEQKDRDHYF